MRDEFGFEVELPPNHQISGKARASQRKQRGISLSDFGQYAQPVESAAIPPLCKSVLQDASEDCLGARFVRYVPVALAALDWKVSARRIRVLLAAKRLEGRQEPNGYWEVAYPYRSTFGKRGPALKRSQKPEAMTDLL
ncbi:MAG: hypothetical protein WBM09_13440 [Gallionella sp.]